jgi:DNA ligase (NAD+)
MTFIIEPTNCPCCDYPLEKVGDQLFCRNLACPAQVNGKILHFCKTLGIKGLGPKTVEKLQLQDITEIFYLDKSDVDTLLGEKVSSKLLDEIERAKVSNLATVIESFSIPLIGGTASRKVASVVSNIEGITEVKCKEAGLGEKATANLLSWLENEYQELKEFLPFSFQEAPQSVPGKTVCITGKLNSYKKKADAESDLLAAGYILVDSVTKATDFLVDEENGASAKRQKADKYGITIITDLNDLLKAN